ncbi:hypothetical protein [Fluoribacter dumoffii]|uniref:Uncharacterized protein n=1 Tax=Fluoribacter dumoffii TaxID=463 RepID=A0A377G7T5_9GAMM|nr:hypothetical protein [Fluoribacter dumoffii]KTC89578.1 hypothetical protein Ldum_0646 [Fluoribacter dumoffii NY 23]STO20689.1 Uncharacterised protein [Fluoribacter dumoffii]
MKNNKFDSNLEQNDSMQIDTKEEAINQELKETEHTKRKQATDEDSGRKSRKKGKKQTVEKNDHFTTDSMSVKKLRKQSFPILEAYYKTHLLNHEQVKQKLEELRDQTKNPLEFLLLFKFDFFKNINHKTDPVFQWFLDELERCIEDLPKYQPRRKGSTNEAMVLVKSVCANEALLAEVLRRDKIKAVICKYYIFVIIHHLFDVEKITANPLELLHTYFSDIIEHVKTNPIQVNENGDYKNLLDLFLHPQYAKYLLALWKEGFRPFSQQRFNELLFSFYIDQEIGEFSLDITQLYTIVTRDGAFQDFLVFSEEVDPFFLFLENPLIDVNLFKELLKKIPKGCDYELLLQDALSQNKYNTYIVSHREEQSEKYLNLINKIIFCLSELPAEMPWESSPTFQNKTQSDLQILMTAGLSASIASSINTQVIIPETTLANEVLFFGLKLLFKDAKRLDESLKKLIHILKEKNVNQSELLNLFLYFYLTNNHQLHKNNLFNELLQELTLDIPSHEMIQVISKYISLLNVLHAKVKEFQPQQGLAWRQAIPEFMLFLTRTISLNSAKQTAIHLKVPLALCNLLIVQVKLQCPSDDQKGIFMPDLEKVMIYFFRHIQEIRDEKLDAKILMTFALHMINSNKHTGVQLLEIISQMFPSWLKYTSITIAFNGRKLDFLSVLLNQLSSKDHWAIEKNSAIISYLLTKLKEKKIPIPMVFLENIAELQLNFQKKSLLTPKAQEAVEIIVNQCLHQVQGTEQETPFEEIRTKILLKADLDPTKDPQAIHTKENHLYADQVYQEWLQALGTEEDKGEKITKGLGRFFEFLVSEKEKHITESLASIQDPDELKKLVAYIYGIRRESDSEEIKEIHTRINTYNKTLIYLKSIQTRAVIPIHSEMKPDEIRAIEDAKKLLGIIAMVGYYSNPSLNQLFIRDGNEALHILKLELFDQIEHPSCDQGPYMRFLMALEPVTNIKFPTLQRRTIPFIVKNYINEYYQQLPPEAKQQFIQEIYGKIEDLEDNETVEIIPAYAFAPLVDVFLAQNQERLGYLTPKEVRDLFNLERPKEYHPEIVKDLNQCLLQKKRKASPNTTNPHSFFAATPAVSADDMSPPNQGLKSN